MARFLLTVWPFPTHLHPNLAVAHALQTRGHEIAFYTDSSAVPLVEAEGFACFPFRSLNWSRVRNSMDRILDATGRPGELRLWREFLLDPIPAQLEDLDSLWAKFRPDALVCDMGMWGPFLMWREERRLPAAMLSHLAYCLLRGSSRRGAVMAARGRPDWRQRFRAGLASIPQSLISAHFKRAANRLRRQRGLAPIGISVTEFGGTLPLYIVPSAPEFDDERSDLPESVHYVGPCFFDAVKTVSPPAWIADLREPFVLAEEGGLFAPEPRFLAQAASAFDSLQIPSVVLLGDGREPNRVSFGPLASNVRVAPWTPLSHLLPRTSVMVSSGNSESVLAALQAGVPVIVVPSIWEQMEVASRVEHAGAGLRISRRKCTPGRLRGAVEKVLADPSYRAEAQRVAQALARRGGANRAASLIETYLL